MANYHRNGAGFGYKTGREDIFGPIPSWQPDSRKPWKPGKSRMAWIWPRDKKMSGPPMSSLTRWKDVFLRRGPPVYVGDRTSFSPTKPTWSGWAQVPEFDNLGYRDEDMLDWTPHDGRYYDFRTRRWTRRPFRPEVWSDVRWGGRDGQVPLCWRDGLGVEFTRRSGLCRPFDDTEAGNDFRYRPHMPERNDWNQPWPAQFWNYADN